MPHVYKDKEMSKEKRVRPQKEGRERENVFARDITVRVRKACKIGIASSTFCMRTTVFRVNHVQG